MTRKPEGNARPQVAMVQNNDDAPEATDSDAVILFSSTPTTTGLCSDAEQGGAVTDKELADLYYGSDWLGWNWSK